MFVSLLHALLVSKTKRRKKKRLIIIIGFIHLEYNAKLFERIIIIVIGKRRSREQKHDGDDKNDIGTTKDDNDIDVFPTNE